MRLIVLCNSCNGGDCPSDREEENVLDVYEVSSIATRFPSIQVLDWVSIATIIERVLNQIIMMSHGPPAK